jgi:hypothetical protein
MCVPASVTVNGYLISGDKIHPCSLLRAPMFPKLHNFAVFFGAVTGVTDVCR